MTVPAISDSLDNVSIPKSIRHWYRFVFQFYVTLAGIPIAGCKSDGNVAKVIQWPVGKSPVLHYLPSFIFCCCQVQELPRDGTRKQGKLAADFHIDLCWNLCVGGDEPFVC